MTRALVIEVRLPGGRYHGQGNGAASEWPPSPMRLFCALVAGAYGGRWAAEDRDAKDAAFRWLERLPPPAIAAPQATTGAKTSLYVPNNDLDSVGGDLARIGEIRGATKLFHPRIFDANQPITYVWPFDDGEDHAEQIRAQAERLYALGRGIDMAFADAAITTLDDAEARLMLSGGRVSRPSEGGGRVRLPCPEPGTMTSLVTRHEAERNRFGVRGTGRGARTAFQKAPNARVRQVAYDSPATFLLYELRAPDGAFFPWRAARTVALGERIRDKLLATLASAAPDRASGLEAAIKGSKIATNADKTRRLRFLPLPSVGFEHTDGAIRRIAIEIPSGCPVTRADIDWALNDGEILDGYILTPPQGASGADMLDRYRRTALRWRSVTPVALPSQPHGRRETGDHRARREAAAASRLLAALSHAGIPSAGVRVTLRAEPFQRHGGMAAGFAHGRFTRDRLYHAELVFPEPIAGPLAIGDGRFLGLGLFEPVLPQSIHAYALGRRVPKSQIHKVCKILHHATISCVRDTLIASGGLKPDDTRLDVFFSGHDRNGAPARSGRHEHLFFALHPNSNRLLIVAPHRAEHRSATASERSNLEVLDTAQESLHSLYSETLPALMLRRAEPVENGDPLVGPSQCWISVTPFRPTRHPGKDDNIKVFLRTNIADQCAARGLPRPDVEIIEHSEGQRGGWRAVARLKFAVPVRGPILLGWDSHVGGGVFETEMDQT